MYSRVLVPLDGSSVSAQAVPYARVLAQAGGMTMGLMRVVPTIGMLMSASAMRGYAEAGASNMLSYEEWQGRHNRLRDTVTRELGDFSGTVNVPGVQVDTVVREGEPADEIVHEAGQQAGTLIAMTTHGRSGLGRWMLGSVTDKVVRQATGPVLVIRARKQEEVQAEPRFQRIILPLDGSRLAEAAMPTAVSWAKALNAPITVVRSISLAAYGYGFSDYTLPEYSMGEFASGVRDDVKVYLDRVVDDLHRQGVSDVTSSAPDGNPAESLLREAEESPNSMIVMTTHGRTGIGRWVMGSVTDRVVRHASCPVMVLRSVREDAEKPGVGEATGQAAE